MSNEHAVIFLIKIILFNDDTKMVEKYIFKFLVEQMQEDFLNNKNLLKIFVNIISPFNSKVNTQVENKILKYHEDSSSKKDMEKRKEELLEVVIEEIYKVVNPSLKFFLTSANYSTLLVELIAYLVKVKDEEKLKDVLRNLLTTLEIDYKNYYDDLSATIIAGHASHFVVNKIVKTVIESTAASDFIKGLVKLFLTNFEGLLKSKAIFIIVTIFETEAYKKLLDKEMRKMKSLIAEQAKVKEMTGFQILEKLLSQ